MRTQIVEVMRLAKERGEIGGHGVDEFAHLALRRLLQQTAVLREILQIERPQTTYPPSAVLMEPTI